MDHTPQQPPRRYRDLLKQRRAADPDPSAHAEGADLLHTLEQEIKTFQEKPALTPLDRLALATFEHLRTQVQSLLPSHGRAPEDLLPDDQARLRELSESFHRTIRPRVLRMRAWEAAHQHALSPAQQQGVARLLTSLRALTPLNHRSGQEMETMTDEEHRSWKPDVNRYWRSLFQAFTLGLDHHPLVAEALASQRRLGNRALLRRAKCGLERGVRPPLRGPSEWTNPGLDPERVQDEYRRLRAQGHSFSRIHQTLAARGSIPNKAGRPMSRQALREILASWGAL
jgi:hypothetical protein